MPSYPYLCHDCGQEFEITKRVADFDKKEDCKGCGSGQTERLIAMVNLEHSSMQQPYYEPALGCIIKGKEHKRQILKQKGLEEVGTTSTDNLYKDLELQREKRMAQAWDDL